MSDRIFEGIAAGCEEVGEVFVDEFVAMFLMSFVAIRGTHAEFSDVVKECGEV